MILHIQCDSFWSLGQYVLVHINSVKKVYGQQHFDKISEFYHSNYISSEMLKFRRKKKNTQILKKNIEVYY